MLEHSHTNVEQDVHDYAPSLNSMPYPIKTSLRTQTDDLQVVVTSTTTTTLNALITSFTTTTSYATTTSTALQTTETLLPPASGTYGSQGFDFAIYPGVDFPGHDLGSCPCSIENPTCTINGFTATCQSFNDCMDICVRREVGDCRGVSYTPEGASGGPPTCMLKSAVPMSPSNNVAGCGVLRDYSVDSAVVVGAER